jgi:hypothetical protein
MTIDQSNRVGIGYDPSWPLTVSTASSGTAAVFLYDGAFASTGEVNVGLRFYNGGGIGDIPQIRLAAYGTSNYTGNFGIRVLQGGTYPNTLIERFTVAGLTGYVGVGTTAPVSQIEALSSSTGRVGVTVTNANVSAGPAYIAFKGYDWVRSAIWNDRANGAPLQFAVNPDTSDLTVGGCAVVGGFTTGGVFYAKSGATVGTLQGNIVTGSSGTASIGAIAGGGGVIDTNITINQISAGGTMLFLCSNNYSNGASTVSAVYMIQLYYDGNNTPAVTLISGSNSWTFGKSSSNTLTVSGPGGNNAYAWFGNK